MKKYPFLSKLVSLVIITAIFTSCANDSDYLMHDSALTVSEWSDDLRYLERELPRRHANAFHTVNKKVFDSTINTLRAELSNLSQDSIYVRFRQIVTMIGDGHTYIAYPSKWPRVPMRFQWFGDLTEDSGNLELRVTHTTEKYRHFLGARVSGIGDHSISTVYESLTSIIPSEETEGWSRYLSSLLMRRPHLLRGLGHITDTNQFSITFTDLSDQHQSAFVQPLGLNDTANWYTIPEKLPMYIRQKDEPFWYTRLTDEAGDSSTVYLAFNSYPGYFSFWRQSRDLLKFIDQLGTSRLVIDLRNNDGGDYMKTRLLLIPGLKKRFSLNSNRNVYVLIGPVTFSAAMTNAVDFRDELGAILVGEPTGARPNQYQESDSFTLPNSGLRVGVATRYYQFQEIGTPGVLPDHLVRTNWNDYRAGRDKVLEWILAQ